MIVFAPMALKRLNYDPMKDFAPVSQVVKFQYAFAVGPNHPARTVPEFVSWAQANSGQANYGTPGTGSVPHFSGCWSAARQASRWSRRLRGAASLATELMGGQVPSGISALSDLIELHRAGKVTSSRPRAPSAHRRCRRYRHSRSKVSEGRRHRLDRLVCAGGNSETGGRSVGDGNRRAAANPAVREKLIKLGLEPTGTSPEELASIMAADTTHWAPIIKASGFTAD